MGLKRSSYKKKRVQINIVPLIDVLTILIFFFLLTMDFGQKSHLNITPPKIESAAKGQNTPSITLGITQSGDYIINDQTILENELKPYLKNLLKTSQETPILLCIDESTPVRYLTHAMDICTQAGVNQIKLQSRTPSNDFK
jgi:biopolymer transport protein ExbD